MNELLNLTFYSEDAGKDITIKEYIKRFAIQLFIKGICFNSKRPFGNSGWEEEIPIALIKNNVLNGRLEYDEDGYISDLTYDENEYKELITKIFNEI